jgi:hypothetical protein
MTEKLLAATSCSLLLLASACGSGGGGGTPPPPPQPSGPAAEVVECLGKDKVRAKVDKAGAKLVRAPKAQDAVVVRLKGNTANVLFFESKDLASDVKNQVKNESLVNIEQEILIVFQKVPKAAQEKQIEDCLPEDESDQQEDEQQKK